MQSEALVAVTLAVSQERNSFMTNHTSILKIVRFNAQNQGLLLTVQEKDFNRAMSSVSVSVEWKFGKIAQYFAYLDFKKRVHCIQLQQFRRWIRSIYNA